MRSAWQRIKGSFTTIKTTSFVATLIASLVFPVLSNPSIAHATGGINNTRGDAWGTLEVAGTDSSNLSGTGVSIYSNGSTTDYRDCSGNIVSTYTAACKDSVNGIVAGAEWQCVELVNRLYLTKGWTTATWTGDGGVLYDNAPGNLSKEINGSITYLNPGDTLVLQDSGAGHAAIINTYNSGTGAIQIESQNTNVVFDSTFSLNTSTHTISSTGWGTYTVKGIVHHPNSATSRPSAVYRSSTTMNAFYQSGSQLYSRYWDSVNGWNLTNWSVNIASAPSAVARDANDMDVFFRDSSNNLVDQHWNSTTGWATTTLVSNGTVRGDPAVTARDSTDMDVFYRDNSNNLVDEYWNSTTSWGSTYWSDSLLGDPMPIHRTTGTLDVFAQTTSKNLIDRSWNGGTWSATTLVNDGTVNSDIGAVTYDSNHMDAFYRNGANGDLYDEWWDNVYGWHSTYINVTGGTTPDAVSRNSGSIEVFFLQDGTNKLIDEWWAGSGFNTATLDSSGTMATAPSAIYRDSTDTDVFYGTTSNHQSNLADEYYGTSGWNRSSWAW